MIINEFENMIGKRVKVHTISASSKRGTLIKAEENGALLRSGESVYVFFPWRNIDYIETIAQE